MSHMKSRKILAVFFTTIQHILVVHSVLWSHSNLTRFNFLMCTPKGHFLSCYSVNQWDWKNTFLTTLIGCCVTFTWPMSGLYKRLHCHYSWKQYHTPEYLFCCKSTKWRRRWAIWTWKGPPFGIALRISFSPHWLCFRLCAWIRIRIMLLECNSRL